MAQTLSSQTLDALLGSFRQAASALPDARRGFNKRYSVADAAGCAFAPFFMQDPSFLAFQRRMQKQQARSNCQSLFGIERIPTDNCIRSLLDGCPSDAFNALFPLCLDTLDDHAALRPFLRLDNRLLIALDGIEFQSSYKIHCDHCCTRHVGKAKTPQYFHSMVSAAVVADGHNRVIPLPPEFIGPQSDPAAADPELDEQSRKQDCERNAAKRWISKHANDFQLYRPVYLGDDLYCCHPICQLLLDHDTDFIFVCKPSSHKCLQDFLHESLYHSTGWLRMRNAQRQLREYRYRWQSGVPVRDGADAVQGTWIEMTVRRKAADGKGWEQTYYNTFFTSLEVTPDNVAEIARAGRARWKIENETFNCLSRQGYHLKHNFGHGSDGLANLLAVLNLLAFAFHSVLDCLRGLWHQARALLVTRRDFFRDVQTLTKYVYFPHWTALLETLLEERPLAQFRGPTPA